MGPVQVEYMNAKFDGKHEWKNMTEGKNETKIRKVLRLEYVHENVIHIYVSNSY